MSHLEPCPSVAVSFLTIDTSQTSFDEARRDSFGSASPRELTNSTASIASPVTPLGPTSVLSFYETDGWSKAQNQNWPSQTSGSEALWLGDDDPATVSCVMNNWMEDESAMQQFQRGYFYPIMQSKSAIDPPLSRAVFNNTTLFAAPHTNEDMLPWPESRLQPQSHTVEPSATFQPTLPSSPLSKISVMTPLKHRPGNSSILVSSPFSGNSLSILTSQWEVDYVEHLPGSEANDFEEKPHSQSMLRDSLELPAKKTQASSRKQQLRKPTTTSEAVIPTNLFKCSYAGCNKRFRRREHRKRHEDTVEHKVILERKVDTPPRCPKEKWPCWVVTGGKPCGKWFGRKDNLKSHKLRTHGKRSPNSRNAYVATLDVDSPYYDEHWEGQLTAEGLPIGHPKWPEIKG